MNQNVQTGRTDNAHIGRNAFVIAIVLTLAGTGMAVFSGNETFGHVKGRMYVPPGLQGRAQWGEVWLVGDYDRLSRDLAEHERLLVLSLLSKDAGFMRSELDNILRLSEIRAKIGALRDDRIPTRTIPPSTPTVSPLTPVESLLAAVEVQSKPATDREQRDIERRIRALQDSAVVVRGRMQPSVSALMRGRADQKDLLLADADAIAEQHRLFTNQVVMDGEYRFTSVPIGEYGLYARYSLMRWFALTSVTVSEGVSTLDIPRLRGVVTESKAVMGIDVAVNQIERM